MSKLMLDFEKFTKRFVFKENEKPWAEGSYGNLYESKDSETGELVHIKVSRIEANDYIEYPEDLVTKQTGLMKIIRKRFLEWMTHILSQETDSPKLEAFAMKIEGGPKKAGRVTVGIKSYMAFQPLKGSLYKFHLEEKVQGKEKIKPPPMGYTQYSSLVHCIIELLDFFQEHNIIHGNMNPANLMYSKEDESVKLVDFGIGKLLTEEVKGVRVPENRSYCHPEFHEPEETDDIELLQFNDKFCSALVLLQLGTQCKLERLFEAKVAFSSGGVESVKYEMRKEFEHITKNYDKRYVMLIERLIGNESTDTLKKFLKGTGRDRTREECIEWWNDVIAANQPWVELRYKNCVPGNLKYISFMGYDNNSY